MDQERTNRVDLVGHHKDIGFPTASAAETLKLLKTGVHDLRILRNLNGVFSTD